ncbi:MAG: translesion DNA synthesis-associated protein ImuA [Arenicella sp.]|nr:translesion DNA synthesis-associated protein ImuA [Arenicella sp.]
MTFDKQTFDKTVSNSVFTDKDKACRPIQMSARPYSVINTGFIDLDRVLAVGGWPLGTTTEIGLADDGIGELRLLLPALRNSLNQSTPHVVWIAPPYLPYSQALIREHINPDNLIVVTPKNIADTLWAAEQILLADNCSALFTWTGKYNLSQKETRRLQLAAEKSCTWHVQFRDHRCLQQASAARMRLALDSTPAGKLSVTVNKQPQGTNGQQCSLSLSPHYEQWQQIPTERLPQHNRPLLRSPIKQRYRVGSKAVESRRTIAIE